MLGAPYLMGGAYWKLKNLRIRIELTTPEPDMKIGLMLTRGSPIKRA